MLYILTIILLASCMGNFDDLNPTRTRVSESLSELISKPNNLSIGQSEFTFSVCSDVHITTGEVGPFNRILEETYGAGDQFLMVLGDIADTGQKSQFTIFQNHVARYPFPHGVFTLMGNHDAFFGGWDHYKKLLGPSVYTFLAEHVRIIALDTANSTLGKRQFDWLEQVLEENSQEVVLAFSHVGVYSGGLGSIFKLSSKEETYRLFNIFERFGVSHMFSGHFHTYVKKQINATEFYVTGGAGDGILDRGPNHYLRIHINGNSVQVTKHDI